jgi:AraC-like DNA-binding protein
MLPDRYQYRPIRNSIRIAPSCVQIRTCAPDRDLAPYLLEFWEMQVPPSVPYVPNQIYPSGAVILRFDISDGKVDAVLYGPSLSRYMRGLFFPHVTMFGTALQPGRGYHLLGLPVSELTDLRIQMDQLWPKLVRLIREQLAGTQSFAQRVTVLSGFLRKIIRHDPTYAPDFCNAFSSLVLSAGDVDAAKHATSAPVSARTLRRQFTKYLGLSPKEMSRVVRFQRVLAEMTRRHRVDFAGLAQRHGYSDQAHLIRDFASLIGVPPGRYLSYGERLHDPGLPIWTGSHSGQLGPPPAILAMR